MIKKYYLTLYIKLLDFVFINKNKDINLHILDSIKLSLLNNINVKDNEFIKNYFSSEFFVVDVTDHSIIELNNDEIDIIIKCIEELKNTIKNDFEKEYLIFPLIMLFKLLFDGKGLNEWFYSNYIGVYRKLVRAFLFEDEKNYINDTNPSLSVGIVDILCNCEYRNYGRLLDHCNLFYYRFTNKVYGVLSNIGEGAWALSYTLAGRNSNFNKSNYNLNSSIMFNNQEIKMNDLLNISCYVDNYPIDFTKWELKTKNLIYFLNKAKKKSNFKDNIDEVLSFFGLENFENRKLNQLGIRFLNATLAIGYVLGKKIYCFPYISPLANYQNKIRIYSKFLSERGAIVLIPTDDRETIKYIADETVDIINDSCKYYYFNISLYPTIMKIEIKEEKYLFIKFNNGFTRKLDKQVLINQTIRLLKGNKIFDIKICSNGECITWNNDNILFLDSSALWLYSEDI